MSKVRVYLRRLHYYAVNSTALFDVIPAASVFAFKTPTFEIKRLISVSLAAVPLVTSAICCWALSQAWVVILLVTLYNYQLYPPHRQKIQLTKRYSQHFQFQLPDQPY